ncbi:glycerate kinase family protein [Streptococcus jiangjianxini]|uniref:glycerate kinase family protein n=1 Tax=Streptococcus jiangjianxini TaxID=3161189 RepID=UPI0032EFED0F
MKKTIVLAPDSFKESMTAKEVCEAMERGIQKVWKDAEVLHVPMADGGEGTVDALVDATHGKRIPVQVTGPMLGTTVSTYFGMLGDGRTAVIEMAKANGIDLLPKSLRNPMKTSTYGTGEMIKAALDHGAEKIIIGIGGSVTNDGGSGMANALGVNFLDISGQSIEPCGGSLDRLHKIDISGIDPRLSTIDVLIASDVTNPLTGEEGASRVFGPQKGATAEMVDILDKNLKRYAKVINDEFDVDVDQVPGAGAAGGLGAGLLAFTNSQLRSGIDIVIDVTGLEEYIKKADYVFTGEGGMDFQTKFGKAPYGVSKLAQKYGKPVFACAGHIGENVDVLYDEGMTAIFGILSRNGSLEDILADGKANIERTTENIIRVLSLTQQ